MALTAPAGAETLTLIRWFWLWQDAENNRKTKIRNNKPEFSWAFQWKWSTIETCYFRMGVSKNRGFSPKMDGEFSWFQTLWTNGFFWGGKLYFCEHPNGSQDVFPRKIQVKGWSPWTPAVSALLALQVLPDLGLPLVRQGVDHALWMPLKLPFCVWKWYDIWFIMIYISIFIL